ADHRRCRACKVLRHTCQQGAVRVAPAKHRQPVPVAAGQAGANEEIGAVQDAAEELVLQHPQTQAPELDQAPKAAQV
ncbi:hypothetical protein IWQ56_006235, partial [Coemansia nantahalensis]